MQCCLLPIPTVTTLYAWNPVLSAAFINMKCEALLPSMALHKHPLGIYSTWHLSSAVTSRSSLCQMGHLSVFLKKPVKETTTVGHVYPLVTYLTTLSAKLILYVMVTKCCSLLNTCDCDGCLFSRSVSGGKRTEKPVVRMEKRKLKTNKDTTNTRV